MCYDARSAAGWSSLVARRAHNPKVAGSNPAPATKEVFTFYVGTTSRLGRSQGATAVRHLLFVFAERIGARGT